MKRPSLHSMIPLLAVALVAGGCTARYRAPSNVSGPTVVAADSRLTFSVDCRNNGASADVKATVAAVLAALNVTTCDAADAAIALQPRLLDLSNRNLTSVSSLSGLPYVQELRLDGNPVVDVTPLATMPLLRTASLGGIQGARGLNGMRNLQRLYLDNANISDLTNVGAMCGSLELLSLKNNRITSLTPLSACASLKSLYIGGNNISDITPLSHLSQLSALNADGNVIADVSALSGQAQLTLLSLLDNPILNLTPLAGLATMQVIYLPPAARDTSTCPTATSVANGPLRNFCIAAQNGG